MPILPDEYIRPYTILILIGLILFISGGVNVYSTPDPVQKYNYTMTNISEDGESTESRYQYVESFEYEELPETDQSIVKRTLKQGGNYTTSQEASEFIFLTDAHQANKVTYENESYRLVAKDETSGTVAAIFKTVLWIPLTLVGALLLLIGMVKSPLRQKVRENF